MKYLSPQIYHKMILFQKQSMKKSRELRSCLHDDRFNILKLFFCNIRFKLSLLYTYTSISFNWAQIDFRANKSVEVSKQDV